MNDRDKQFVQYWEEMEKRGRKFYIRRNIKILFITVIPVITVVNLLQNGFSISYLTSPSFLVSLFMLLMWCVIFGYGFSIFSWKNNAKRYLRLKE